MRSGSCRPTSPPHKTDHQITDTNDRCEMVKLAQLRNIPISVFQIFEISRTGNTYTAQTLQLLKEAYPEHTFYFIVGADSLYHIETWYHPELVLGHVTILAARRECDDAACTLEKQADYLKNKYGAAIFFYTALPCISLPKSFGNDKSNGTGIHDLVPDSVERYIREHGLYQHPDRRKDTL